MKYYFEGYKRRLSGNLFIYNNAYGGLYDILVWLRETGYDKNSNIILPAYIPVTMCRLVRKAGYEPRFYEILPGCRIDIDNVKSLTDDQTRAVIFRHYFGIPADARALKSHSIANNLLLIEDCTQALNSDLKGEELGSIGDCAIFNPEKLLQLPAGCFIVTRNKLAGFKPRYTAQAWSARTVCELFRSWGKQIYFSLTRGEDPLGLTRIRSKENKKVRAKQQTFEITKAGWLNKICLQYPDLNLIAHKRRANYEYLLNGIKNLAYIEPLILSCKNMVLRKNGRLYLREGITPYSLPVLVPPEIRDLLVRVLAGRGIECESEQMRIMTGCKNPGRMEELFSGLLEIPVHQGIKWHQLNRIISCLHACQKIEVLKTDKIRKAV